jgi:hypothetical protein
MKRVLCGAAILGLAALATTSGAFARSAAVTCPATATMIAGVTYTVASDTAQPGVQGNTWAKDTYTRTVLVYRVSASTYCAVLRDSGTFTSLGGPSPGGGGYLAPGITGRMTGSVVTNTFSGTWHPVRTSGSLGVFPGPIEWEDYFFSSTEGLCYAWWSWTYGGWQTRSDAPSVGDLRTA